MARITLNTMARFTKYGSGSYKLSVLKKMTGTKSFIGLPDEVKQCQIESFADCQVRRYLEEVNKVCGCVPWSLKVTATMKVITR